MRLLFEYALLYGVVLAATMVIHSCTLECIDHRLLFKTLSDTDTDEDTLTIVYVLIHF